MSCSTCTVVCGLRSREALLNAQLRDVCLHCAAVRHTLLLKEGCKGGQRLVSAAAFHRIPAKDLQVFGPARHTSGCLAAAVSLFGANQPAVVAQGTCRRSVMMRLLQLRLHTGESNTVPPVMVGAVRAKAKTSTCKAEGVGNKLRTVVLWATSCAMW